METKSTLRIISHKLQKFSVAIDISLAVLVVAGLVLIWTGRQGKNLISPVLLLAALYYFLLVFSELPDEQSRLVYRLTFRINTLSVSIVLAGLFLFLNNWPMNEFFLATGTVTLLVLVLLMLLMRMQNHEQKTISFYLITRSLLIAIAGVVSYMISTGVVLQG